MYTTISACRICGNQQLDLVLDLGMQALTGVFPKNQETAVSVSPLELVKCRDEGSAESCGLVQLKQSFQPDAMYGMNYGYRSGLNQSMVEHLRRKAMKVLVRSWLRVSPLTLTLGVIVLMLLLFASRPLDLRDAEGVAVRFKDRLDWRYIAEQLGPLAEVKEEPEILRTLARLRGL